MTTFIYSAQFSASITYYKIFCTIKYEPYLWMGGGGIHRPLLSKTRLNPWYRKKNTLICKLQCLRSVCHQFSLEFNCIVQVGVCPCFHLWKGRYAIVSGEVIPLYRLLLITRLADIRNWKNWRLHVTTSYFLLESVYYSSEAKWCSTRPPLCQPSGIPVLTHGSWSLHMSWAVPCRSVCQGIWTKKLGENLGN